MDTTFSSQNIISSYLRKPSNLHVPSNDENAIPQNKIDPTVRRSKISKTTIQSEPPFRRQSLPETKAFISSPKSLFPSSLKRDNFHSPMIEARETFLSPKNQNFSGQQPFFGAVSNASKRQVIRHKSEVNLKEETLLQKSKPLELPPITLNSPSSQQAYWRDSIKKRGSVEPLKDIVNLQHTLQQQYQTPKIQQKTPNNCHALFSQYTNPFMGDKKKQQRQELIRSSWNSAQSLTQLMSTPQQPESTQKPNQLSSLVLSENNDDMKSVKSERSMVALTLMKRIEFRWLDRINDLTMPKGIEHCTLTVTGTKMYMFSNVLGTAAPSNQKDSRQYCPFLVYNFLKGKWKTPKTTSEFPIPGRIGHTTVLMKTQLYVFGGAVYGKDKSLKNGTTVSDLIIYHPTLKKWTRPTKNGAPPRKFHAACGRNGLMLVYGGIDPKGRYLNDVWVYDSADSSFWELSGDSKPDIEGIAYHSMVEVFNNSKSSIGVKVEGFYCYGGCTSRGEHNSALKILTFPGLNWINPKTRGKQPPYKIEPSVCYHERSRSLIVCGGKPIVAKKLTEQQIQGASEIYVLCLESFIWTQAMAKGELSFKERHRHTTVCYRDEMIIFGGFGYGDFPADAMDKLLITPQNAARKSIQASTTILDDKSFKPVQGTTSLNDIPDL